MAWKIVLVIYLAGYVNSEKDAISEQRVVIHQVKSEHGDKPLQDGSKKTEYREEYAWSYPSYEFSYKVNDPETHDIKGQHEKRHGDEVKGLYWLIEPNGHKRTVNYQADDNTGFNAQVDYTGKQESSENNHGKNIEENNDVEEKAKEINEDKAPNEEISNNEKEQDGINNQANGNEQTELGESNLNQENNFESQDNAGAAELETANQNENNGENQNNENNMMNVIENNNDECCSENSQNENNKPVYEENNEDMEYNNRRKSRAHDSKNESSDKLENIKNTENGRNRRNRNNKYRYRQNIEQNRKSKRGEHNQKHATRVSRDGKNKENIGIDLKNNNDEKKEQSHNHEKRLALSTKEDLPEINKNIEDNKSNRFEHRIRIHHPKPNKRT